MSIEDCGPHRAENYTLADTNRHMIHMDEDLLLHFQQPIKELKDMHLYSGIPEHCNPDCPLPFPDVCDPIMPENRRKGLTLVMRESPRLRELMKRISKEFGAMGLGIVAGACAPARISYVVSLDNDDSNYNIGNVTLGCVSAFPDGSYYSTSVQLAVWLAAGLEKTGP
ncbi:hypothetical protein FQN55_004762 [Onygenales sp. PD_40]|nr:hypothetical protein FQN55_004762 [Onygenales sp. PD_40]